MGSVGGSELGPCAEVPAEPHPGPSLTAGQGTGASVPGRRRGERDQAPGVLVSVRPANPEWTDWAVYKLPTFISQSGAVSRAPGAGRAQLLVAASGSGREEGSKVAETSSPRTLEGPPPNTVALWVGLPQMSLGTQISGP